MNLEFFPHLFSVNLYCFKQLSQHVQCYRPILQLTVQLSVSIATLDSLCLVKLYLFIELSKLGLLM